MAFFRFSSNPTIHAYVEEDFVIWRHKHFFFEMPLSRWISFLVTFSIHKTSHVLFLEMLPFPRFEIFEMPHFPIERIRLANGTFQGF